MAARCSAAASDFWPKADAEFNLDRALGLQTQRVGQLI